MFFKKVIHSNLLYILLAVLLGWIVTETKLKSPLVFKIELTVETNAKDQSIQFYCHINNTYKGESVDENHYSAENLIDENTYQIVNDITCGEQATHLRFDPLPAHGKVDILSMRVHTQYWHQVELSEAIKHIKALHSIESVVLNGKKISIIANGNDPYIELSNNLQSYLKPAQKDIISLVLKFSFWALVLIKFSTWFLSHVLKNGERVYSFAKSSKAYFDHQAEKLINQLTHLTSKPIPVSSWLVFLGFSIILLASFTFANHLSQQLTFGSILIVFFSALHFFFIFSIYILFLSFLGHFKWVRVLLGFLFLCCFLFIFADVSLFTLNGMHVKHGLGMLVDGGIDQFFNNLRFTQLSKSELSLYLGLILTSIIVSFIVVWFVEFKLRRSHFKVSIKLAMVTSMIALLSIFLTQHISPKHLNQNQIVTYEHHHPLGISFFNVNDYIVSFDTHARPFERLDSVPTISHKIQNNEINNIYLFIFESIREDVVNSLVTPRLVEFKENAWQFEQAIASGNATHYGWFSMINSRQPFFWERYRDLEDKKGSVPLQLIKQLGYQINVYSAKDLSYLQSDQTMFGQNLSLIDYISPHPEMSTPEHDQRAIDELLNDIKEKHQQSKNLNIIFLDSSHYPYRWSANKIKEIQPFLGTAEEGTTLSNAKNLIKKDKTLIFNRYKNSIKYMDHLFGEMLDAITKHNLMPNSMIIAVGDHGQQFMEHDYMMHGFTLFREDINVPLYIKGANIPAKTDSQVASHLDIMPTILDHIGVDLTTVHEIDGHSLFSVGNNNYKLSSVAGEQNTPASFVISSTKWKLFFRTDSNNTNGFNKINITQVTTHDDVDHMPANGLQSDYLNFINKEFPGFLKQISIFK